MNNDLFLDIAQSLEQNWGLLLTVLGCAAWGSLLVFACLKKAAQHLGDGELTALALGGWPAPVLLWAILVLVLRNYLPDRSVLALAGLAALAAAGLALRHLWGRVSRAALLPMAVFLAFVLLRLGFLAEAVLPAYFDSAEHYRIIQYLLGRASAWTPDSYYHLGYHYITAALQVVTGADLARLMLAFGQVIVAALPLPMYFFVHQATGSRRAAFFAATLAGLGWFVPAHAVNWGKYPALLGLLVVQFTFGLACLDRRYLALLSLLFAVRIHTRMAVLAAVGVAAVWLARRPRWLVAAGLGAVAMLVWRGQDFGPLWDADGNSTLGTILNAYAGLPLGPLWGAYGNLTTLLIGLLAVFAARSFPRLTAGSALALLAGLFLTLIPPAFPVLDRPLTEMALSLLLAFVGGLGLSRLPHKWLMPLLTAAVLVHAWLNYSFAPSPCCQLAGRDDLAAMDWIEQNTPPDARILIASADYSLGQATLRGAGTDAGLWVTPLTGRVTPALPYSSDFSQAQVHQRLCWGGVDYIYAGSREMSFNDALLDAQPAWYTATLILPNARIVQVHGCGE